ncbi:biopolymer transporter ExbD [Aquabacterium sp. J223]|uniref:ExbD/TolR family protein n=1 Tax=Aquabacterium sp. J223 TaxID=2898431 RepID=UPI0021AE1D16|nr:biopolymer transporter ExbD [Aquabacterium sp. J223]UUX96146.1 biopolymer transporter ExbD [Aquabacterium sp. J223]
MRTFPQRRERKARIEIIPMIDVMMFLLVFFVLISTNVLPALGLKVSLPGSAQPERLKDEPVRITLTVDRDGAVYVDGQSTPMAQVAARLKAVAGSRQAKVIIAGDGSANLQTLVALLDQLKAAGMPAASIVTRQQS